MFISSIIRVIRAITSTLAVVRLKPFDGSTREGRGQERVRRAMLTSLTAAIARAITMATPLITIPITLEYLGNETYGLWMTISSIAGLFAFCDLGLGNGLVTFLSQSHGKADQGRSRRLVSTATFFLTVVALLMGLLLLIAWPYLDWSALFNIQNHGAAAAAPGIVLSYAFCFILNLPLANVQRVQLALQDGFLGNIWQCVGSLVGLIGTCIAVYSRANAAIIVLFTCLSPLLSTAANWLHYFYVTNPTLRPNSKEICIDDGKALFRTGIGFVLLSILTTTGIYADNVLIAHILGLEAVTSYSIPLRMAMMLNTLVALLCGPLWAANGEALARGDTEWIRKNTTRLLKVSLGATVCAALILTFLGGPIISLWLGKPLMVPIGLMAGLGFGTVTLAAASPYFMVLNGANVIFPQVRVFLIFAPVSIALKSLCLLVLGLTWMPWVGALCYLLVVLPPIIHLSRKTLEEAPSNKVGSATTSPCLDVDSERC